MTTPSPDARAVVAAVDRLTTQVRRLADTRQTPTDDATTTCDASTLGIANRHLGPCVLRDGHDGPVHRGPEGETWATVVAEAHTLADGTEAGFRAALAAAADEEQQRTERRRSLRVLLNRLNNGLPFTASEAQLLTRHVADEITDANDGRKRAEQADAVTAETKRLLERRTTTLRERAERAEAAIERVRKALDDRPPILNAEGQGITDYETGWRDHDAVVRAALDGTEQPTEAQPDENARLIAEYQAAVLRVLAVSDNPLNGHAPAGPEQEAYVRGWRFAIHEVRRAIESSEQPTTKEPS
ncbi:hypothetical protein ACFW5X_28345 [Streptomyces albogriseolus]|uniref:hypothetical protein n=1 Tax=Streptomyces albogriseolus TaxID=1887 RepID=UPI0036B3A5F2